MKVLILIWVTSMPQPDGFVLILQSRARKKGSPWLIFILLPFNGLSSPHRLAWKAILISIDSHSGIHLVYSSSLSDCEKRPQERGNREDINNRRIISIFLSVKMSISNTTCEYEMILLKSLLHPSEGSGPMDAWEWEEEAERVPMNVEHIWNIYHGSFVSRRTSNHYMRPRKAENVD